MATETRTEYETVEKKREVKVCDSCGTAEDELPEDVEDFETVWVGDPEVETGYGRNEVRIEVLAAGRSHPVNVVLKGDRRDLCPICFGAVFD